MILLEFESGSTLTGTAIEGSDVDRIAIVAEPPGAVTGLWRAKSSQIKDVDGDLTLHPLRKFARLAMEGNPNLIQTFFVPDERITFETPWSQSIIGARDLFVSRHAGHKFLGFAKNQRAAMAGERNNRTNRPDLVEAHGFDTKFAGHAYRIAAQGAEFMSTGRLSLPMRNPWRSTVVAIRSREFTYEQALQLVDEQIARLTAECAVSALRDHPDYVGINEWLHEVLTDAWDHMGDPYAGIPRES